METSQTFESTIAEDEKEELRMPTPPVDWALNDLLIKIADELTTDDFEKAKAMFKGDEGLGRRLLSTIKTPLELFDALQKHIFLDRNNFLYLQAMLYNLGRMDLYDLAIEYTHKIGDVIHFSVPPEEPANGYIYVQFHIEGKDFSKVKRSCIETIRTIAARLMLVPPQFVTIAGIEPSSSLLITLMVPERFLKYLEAALNNKAVMKELTNLDIDMVRTGATVVNLHGIEEVDILKTEDQTKLKTVYEQLQDTKAKLEDRDIECIELNRKLSMDRNKENTFNDQVKALLMRLLFEYNLKNKVARLSKHSSLVFFKHSLNLVRQKNYDEATINLLLDAHACVLSARVQDIEELRIKSLLVEIQGLKADLFQLQLANSRLQFLNVVGSRQFEIKFRQFLEELQSVILGQGVLVPETLWFNPVIFQILKEISGMLRPEERKVLLNAYSWPEEDELTKQLKEDETNILALLVAKETNKTGRQIVLEEYIQEKLSLVKRVDLKILFSEMVASTRTEYRYNPAAAASHTQQQTKSSKQQSKASRHQTKSGKQNQPKAAVPPPPVKKTLDEQVELLLKKVSNIEGIIEAAQTSYKASNFGADILQQNPLSNEIKTDPRGMFDRYGTYMNSK